MKEPNQFPNVTHFTQVDVQPGGINIQHVENLYQADFLKALGIELEAKRVKDKDASSDALLPFILDDKERIKVAQAFSQCKDSGQVAILTKRIYDDEILPFEILRSADFQRAIIPLLNFETTEAAIKQAILKQVK